MTPDPLAVVADRLRHEIRIAVDRDLLPGYIAGLAFALDAIAHETEKADWRHKP